MLGNASERDALVNRQLPHHRHTIWMPRAGLSIDLRSRGTQLVRDKCDGISRNIVVLAWGSPTANTSSQLLVEPGLSHSNALVRSLNMASLGWLYSISILNKLLVPLQV